MQRLKFGVVSSGFLKGKFFFNEIHLKTKKYATHALPLTKMGAPHTDFFNEYIGEAKFSGRQISPSSKICEQSERIEFNKNLRLLNLNKIGDLKNA